MKAILILLINLIIVSTINLTVYSQATSCSYATLLTTNTTETCDTFTVSSTVGSAAGCTGGGFGGSGFFSFFKITTDNYANCISLDIDSVAYTGAVELTLWETCSSGTPSGYVTNSIRCASSLPATFNTTALALTPNTTYYLVAWTKNSGTFQICSKKVIPPANDACSGALQIISSPTNTNNFCYTAGASDPPPATFCALSDENSAWFKFTSLYAGSVTLNINNISCYSGAEGFQVGYYTGTCDSLTNVGCYDNTSGDVTNTITGLTAGQTVYVLIDGNAGAQCSFSISASGATNIDENFSNSQLNIFPNPCKNELNIKFTEIKTTGTIEIFEINSKKVYESNFKSSAHFKLDISNFPQGFYTLKIIFDNKVINKKFIKI